MKRAREREEGNETEDQQSRSSCYQLGRACRSVGHRAEGRGRGEGTRLQGQRKKSTAEGNRKREEGEKDGHTGTTREASKVAMATTGEGRAGEGIICFHFCRLQSSLFFLVLHDAALSFSRLATDP